MIKSKNIIPDQKAFNNGLRGRSNSEVNKILEFTDNCVAVAKERFIKYGKIVIGVIELDDNFVRIVIKDNLGGVEDIARDILHIADKVNKVFENHFSYGVKQGLEGLAGEDGKWSIRSMTQEMKERNVYSYVDGPYNFNAVQTFVTISDSNQWDGINNESGLVVDIKVSKRHIQTFIDNVKKIDAYDQNVQVYEQIKLKEMDRVIDEFVICLEHAIGFYYEEVIEQGIIEFEIEYNNRKKRVNPIGVQHWEDGQYNKIEGIYNLGEGNIKMICEWGRILPNTNTELYYNCQEETCGVEISINGRKYTYGEWIWGKKPKRDKHHRWFLLKVLIECEDSILLPEPLVDKSGFQKTDKKYIKLISILKKIVAKPIRDDVHKKRIEEEKKQKLIKKLREQYGEEIHIEEEVLIGEDFNEIGKDKVDIRTYLQEESIYYELKHQGLNKKTVRQMLEYIFFIKEGGGEIDKFILIGEYCSKGFREDIERIGNYYNIKIEVKTWNEYGIE